MVANHRRNIATTWTMFDVFSLLYFYTRPLIKWFLRKFTCLCELQRICYGNEFGASRHKGVEQSLQLSRVPDIKKLLLLLDSCVSTEFSAEQFREELVPYAVRTVLRVKKIKPNIHPDFAPIFHTSVEAIWGFKRLYAIVEEVRTTAYDCNNREHEEKLLRLWELLMPEEKLESRVTKQWQDIGFQVCK